MYEIISEQSIMDKLTILSDAAKYDVACTSSGVDRRGVKGSLGNSCAAGICHAFASDGRCVSLLKILMTNHCVYDCKYCKNRKSNDIPRATFTPEQICTLTMEFYKRNYIEGLFLSSGIIKSPDYTMERMCQTLRLLRTVYHFNGYIHVKAIPGASNELIYSAGLLADRVSLNMELPTQSSLKKMCPNKSMETILRPMDQITRTIAVHRTAIGKSERMERSGINDHLINSIFRQDNKRIEGAQAAGVLDGTSAHDGSLTNMMLRESPGQQSNFMYPAQKSDLDLRRPFAAAGQSTQMIIGATDETDYDLIRTTQSLYQSFDLKRVFYSGYVPLNDDDDLPEIGTPVPMLREHRLYQADWLMRFYGFHASELLSEKQPFFNEQIDPKCDWAIRHLDQFPVEVNTCSYDMLIRVPGIGPTGVKKIMSARRYTKITFEMLKKMHIALKRAQFFITCGGKMLYRIPFEQRFILNELTAIDSKETAAIIGSADDGMRQMNLFSDFGLKAGAAV